MRIAILHRNDDLMMYIHDGLPHFYCVATLYVVYTCDTWDTGRVVYATLARLDDRHVHLRVHAKTQVYMPETG